MLPPRDPGSKRASSARACLFIPCVCLLTRVVSCHAPLRTGLCFTKMARRTLLCGHISSQVSHESYSGENNWEICHNTLADIQCPMDIHMYIISYPMYMKWICKGDTFLCTTNIHWISMSIFSVYPMYVRISMSIFNVYPMYVLCIHRSIPYVRLNTFKENYFNNWRSNT